MKTRFARLATPGLAMCLIGAPAFARSGAWVTNGPNGGSATALAVDPEQPAMVYAGTASGVFRSVDNGGTTGHASLDPPARTVP